MEESDEHVLLRALRRFVEDSDQSIPRIAELMGVSGTTLSMWIGCSTLAAAHDASRNDGQRGHPRFQYGSRGATAIGGSGRRKPVPRNGGKNASRTSRQFLPTIVARYRPLDGTPGARPAWSADSPVLRGYSDSDLRSEWAHPDSMELQQLAH